MGGNVEPLALPESFDPVAYLPAKVTENGVYHESRRGARLAAELVANGTPQDLQLAERVLDAVLACQERHSDDPHCGNFLWMAEDEVVEDLNAVEFNLEALIPMMIRHGERLPAATQARVLGAIRLGLREIERLDVLVAYSNIAVLDIVNTALGGELLGEAGVAARGYRKLVEWMAFTDQHGIPFGRHDHPGEVEERPEPRQVPRRARFALAAVPDKGIEPFPLQLLLESGDSVCVFRCR